MASGFRLVVIQGPQPGETFTLDKEVMNVGRDPGNDIVINHPQISRQHARLMRQGGLMVLEDLNSRNGTFVNGIRLVTPHTLANGDVIGMGDSVTMTFYGETAQSPETMVMTTQPGIAATPFPPPAARAAYPPPPPAAAAPAPRPAAPPPPPVGPAYAAPPPQAPAKKSRKGLWIVLACLGLLVVCCVIVLLVLWFAPQSFWQTLIDLGIPIPTWPF